MKYLDSPLAFFDYFHNQITRFFPSRANGIFGLILIEEHCFEYRWSD